MAVIPVRRDDLVVSTLDGETVLEVLSDVNTCVGIRVELRTAAATISTMAARLIRTDTDAVSLTTDLDYSTAGQASVVVTTGNLSTIHAALGDDLTLEWSGTVTDSGASHLIRHRVAVVVTSRQVSAQVTLDELTGRYGQLAKACALPSGQTTWTPQIRLGLRAWRREMAMRFGRALDLVYPDQVAALQIAYVIEAVLTFVRSGAGTGAQYWETELTRWRAEQERLWSRLEASVATQRAAWGRGQSSTTYRLEGQEWRTPRGDGPVSYGGGM